MDLRLANAKKVSEAVQKKLTKDLDDIGTMAKTIQNKTKETFTLPPREQLAFAGGGSISEQSAAGAASKKKLQDMMRRMDNLNVKGGGKDDIIKGASGAESKIDGELIRKYVRDVETQTNRKIPKKQMEELKNALRNTEYKKMTPSETKRYRREFNKIKNSLIDEWEKQN